MFKNYFLTAFRNFWRNKIFSLINVLGLSIGISAALVIFLIAHYEFGYDMFEKDGDRIYRIVLDADFNGNEGHSAAVPAPLGTAIQNEVSGIEQTVPVFQFPDDGNSKVSIEKDGAAKPDVFKNQQGIVFTNAQYFYLLPYKWIAGSPKVSLQNPFAVVLTESRAKQYFPSLPAADIIGRQVNYNNDVTVTVSGIVKDLNETTSFNGEEFISLPTITKTHLQDRFMMNVWNDWMSYSQLYIKLSKGSTAAQTEAQIKTLYKKYNKDNQNTISFRLQPLSDVHFNNFYPALGQRIANKTTLYGLLAIAAFLLLLGCINFINLTTAKATQRAKEIGIRKTIGSSRRQLVFQFLGETFFITIIATVVSVIITPLLLRMFSNFTPQGLHFDILHQPSIFLFIFLLIIFVSFLSGLYPALVLSGYKTLSVLKNQSYGNTGETRHAWVRKTLTVSQFVIAQFFVIATLMVSKQINYSLNENTGFRKDGIITFTTPNDTVSTHAQLLLNEIKSIPGVEIASTGFSRRQMKALLLPM